MKQFMLIATAFAAVLHSHNQAHPSELERRLVPALRSRHPNGTVELSAR